MRKIKIGNEEYTLHYGQNAICALEDEVHEGISSFLDRLMSGDLRYKDARAVLWAGLLKDHRDFTPEQVGDMCDAAGVAFSSLMLDCTEEINASFLRLFSNETNANDPEKN